MLIQKKHLYLGFFLLAIISFISSITSDIINIESLKSLIDKSDCFGEVEKLIFSGQMVI